MRTGSTWCSCTPGGAWSSTRAGPFVAECAGPDEQILHAEITLADFRPFSPLQYRRPELYGPILEPPS